MLRWSDVELILNKDAFFYKQVAICAGCNQMETYAAFLIGIGGGVSYMITTWLVLFKLKVDDPLDACAGIYIARSFVASNIPDMKKKYFIKTHNGTYFLTQCIGIHCTQLSFLWMYCYNHVISLFNGMSYQACFCLFTVHYGGGVWGVISVGLLSRDVGILYKWNAEAALVNTLTQHSVIHSQCYKISVIFVIV